MKASEVIRMAASIVNDTAFETYLESEHISAINDAQRLICIHRPDACSSTSTILLDPNNSKQSIPSTARRLMMATRNMGADGSTIGKAIRQTVSFSDMDTIDDDWHTRLGAYVTQVIYDETRPKEFYIYPCVSGAHYIEIKTADHAVDITTGSDNITIDDVNAPCIVSWVVYRLLSRDSDESPNVLRGQEHKNTVYEILGIKTQLDMAVSPNNDRQK